MASMPWFRVYSEILDDKKVKRICRSSGHPKALIIGTWVCLLALANDSNERGRLTISEDMPYKLDDLIDETGLDANTIAGIMDQFVKLDMIVTGGIDQAYEIKNWNGRQFKSDYSTERVRKFRNENSETLQKRYKGVIDTESDTESDTDTESILNLTGDLFDDCLVTWETKTGKPFMPGTDFAEMIKAFEREGVTADIYGQAIEEQRLSTYKVKSPTSVQSWAIGIAEQLRTPRKKQSAKKETVSEYNTRIVKEIMDGKL